MGWLSRLPKLLGGERRRGEPVVPIATVRLTGEQKKNIRKALKTNWIGFGGPFTKALEARFAELCSRSFAVFVSSGSAALHLALSAMDVGAGDEVICPDFSIISLPHAIALCGAKPVFVDVDYNGNIRPDLIEEKLTPRTKAIIAVHAFGIPAEMDDITRLADRHGPRVIEDCSQAHGARYRGRVVGSLGDAACFSLYINKLITAGEGGMIVMDDEELAEHTSRARNMYYGTDERFYHERFGWNYRATDLQAAIALPLCERLPEIIQRRREIANAIRKGLEAIEWIEFLKPPEHVSPVDWVFCVRLKKGSPIDRKELMKRLAAYGVDSRPLFVPFHMQPMYRTDGEFRGAVEIYESGLYVSCHHELKRHQVNRIVEAFNRAFEQV